MPVAAADPARPPPLRRGVAPARAAVPAPLVAPAIALIVGIYLGEALHNPALAQPPATIGGPFEAILVSGIVLAGLIGWSWRRRASRSAAIGSIVLIGLAVTTGVARHARATHIPANHVARLVGDEPLLTRIAGRIVTAPVRHPGEKHNPFLPSQPPDRGVFVLAAREVRGGPDAIPACGLVRVAVALPVPSKSDAPAGRAGAGEFPALRPGDDVVLAGRLYRFKGPRNPGEMDWAAQQRWQGVLAGLRVESPMHVQVEARRETTVEWLRRQLQALGRAALLDPSVHAEDDTTRLIDAIVLGQRSATTRQIDEAFVRAGAVHILSVSGFHVAVIAGTCFVILRRWMHRGLRTASAITLALLVFYGALVEWNAPIVRSTIMAGLACLTGLTRRPLAAWNWLALSAACVLLWNPLELFRAGFQLSFVEVAALLWLGPVLYRWMTKQRDPWALVQRDADNWWTFFRRRAWRIVLGLFCTTVVAWVAAWPLIMLHFGAVAPWAVLQSFLLTPPFALVIVVGFAALLVGWVPFVGWSMAALTNYLVDLSYALVELLASLPGAWIECQPVSAELVLLTYGVIVGILLLRASPAARPRVGPQVVVQARAIVPAYASPRALAQFAMLVAATGGWVWWWAGSRSAATDACQLHVLAVGSGSATLLTTPDGGAAVFDLGTTGNFDAGETARRALATLGVDRLAAASISHENFDHFSGLPTLLHAVPTERLLVNPYFQALTEMHDGLRQLKSLLGVRAPPVNGLQAGDRGSFGAVAYEVLWPPADLENWPGNDCSLVIRLTASGVRVLLTGDIERRAMEALLARHAAGTIDLRADVLVAPHHGGIASRATTADFYAAVRPGWVLVSTGKPRPLLAPLLREVVGSACRVLSTRESGAIVVTISATGAVDVATPFAAGGLRESDVDDDSSGAPH